MKGRVLVFIDGVHGRRSGTSIQDTNHSTNDTCHRLKCLCSLSDLYRPDGVMLHKPPSKGPHHHQLRSFDRQLLSSDRQLLSSDRQHRSSDHHRTDYVTNHSVFTITILVLLCHRSCISIRCPHEYRTVMIVLTVTPIDRLHKSDGPNGVKGAAEEDKI